MAPYHPLIESDTKKVGKLPCIWKTQPQSTFKFQDYDLLKCVAV